MYCKQCGLLVKDEQAVYCPKCGTKIPLERNSRVNDNNMTEQYPKEKFGRNRVIAIIALLLCIAVLSSPLLFYYLSLSRHTIPEIKTAMEEIFHSGEVDKLDKYIVPYSDEIKSRTERYGYIFADEIKNVDSFKMAYRKMSSYADIAPDWEFEWDEYMISSNDSMTRHQSFEPLCNAIQDAFLDHGRHMNVVCCYETFLNLNYSECYSIRVCMRLCYVLYSICEFSERPRA